jgi:predicted RNase H-like HicB family nuclease
VTRTTLLPTKSEHVVEAHATSAWDCVLFTPSTWSAMDDPRTPPWEYVSLETGPLQRVGRRTAVLVIFEKEDTGGYSVRALGHPGACSQGETKEEARAGIREVLEDFLADPDLRAEFRAASPPLWSGIKTSFETILL